MSVSPDDPRSHAAAALLLIVGVLLACASADPVFRLTSPAPDSTSFWVQGRHVITDIHEGVGVAVAYEYTGGGMHVFRTAIANRAGRAFDFDPANVTATMNARDIPTARLTRAPDSIMGSVVPARNPESELLRVDQAVEKQNAEAQNDRLMHGLYVALDVAGDVTAIADGGRTPEEREAEAEEDREMYARFEDERRANARALSALQRERLRWSNVAFRRTTLRPGTEARGLLYIPVDENARTLVLHLPVGSHVVHIPFRQTKYEPEPLME